MGQEALEAVAALGEGLGASEGEARASPPSWRRSRRGQGATGACVVGGWGLGAGGLGFGVWGWAGWAGLQSFFFLLCSFF